MLVVAEDVDRDDDDEDVQGAECPDGHRHQRRQRHKAPVRQRRRRACCQLPEGDCATVDMKPAAAGRSASRSIGAGTEREWQHKIDATTITPPPATSTNGAPASANRTPASRDPPSAPNPSPSP